MKRIVIELDADLNIKAEGIDNPLEGIGILELAKHIFTSYFDEKTGLMEMTEQ